MMILYNMMHPIYATALQLNLEIKLALSDYAYFLYKRFHFDGLIKFFFLS